jgi:hypothetical protein
LNRDYHCGSAGGTHQSAASELSDKTNHGKHAEKLQDEINTGISQDEKPDPMLMDHTKKANPYLSGIQS